MAMEPYGSDMRPNSMRRTAALALSTFLALTACGASEGAVDSVPDTAPDVSDDRLDVEFSSEPIEAGPLFGTSSGVVSEADSADSTSCFDGGEGTCPEANDGEPLSFDPAPEDRPFCSLLVDLEGRPFPSDDEEAVVVVRAWIGELRVVAVEPVQTDLDLLIEVLDDAIRSGGDLTGLELTEELDEASIRLDTYVDSACTGLGTTEPSGDDQTLDDPLLPDGLTVPVIEFASVASTRQRIFGEKNESRISEGFVPAEADRSFCTALDIVNSRPQPSEDFDEVRFVDGYVRAIQPVVPAEIAAEIGVVLAWTANVVEAGSFTEEAEAATVGEVGDAVETIDGFVDARCHGL